MDSTQLKTTLISLANTIDQAAKIFPVNLDTQIVQILSNLDDTTAKIIATLLNMNIDDLKKLVPDLINLFNTSREFFTTGEYQKVSGFCRALANRPFILALIAKII